MNQGKTLHNQQPLVTSGDEVLIRFRAVENGWSARPANLTGQPPRWLSNTLYEVAAFQAFWLFRADFGRRELFDFARGDADGRRLGAVLRCMMSRIRSSP